MEILQVNYYNDYYFSLFTNPLFNQSSGTAKEVKKNKKGKDNKKTKKNEPHFTKVIIPKNLKDKDPNEDAEDDDQVEQTVQADVDMLDALTGLPLPEDELLFAIPVIAPYNTLSSYK